MTCDAAYLPREHGVRRLPSTDINTLNASRGSFHAQPWWLVQEDIAPSAAIFLQTAEST